jgi:hypothetical protein
MSRDDAPIRPQHFVFNAPTPGHVAPAMRCTVPVPTPNRLAILCRPGRSGAARASRMRPSSLVTALTSGD